MQTIEIYDRNEHGILDFDLVQILQVIESFAGGLDWYVLEFEPTAFCAEKDMPQSLTCIYEKLIMTDSGVRLDWPVLVQLAEHTSQTMNALIIAIPTDSNPPRQPLDLNDPNYSIVIQAVDTSFWAITSKSTDLIEKLHRSFRETKMVPATARYF